MSEADEINARIDEAVAYELPIPRRWEHPSYPAGTWVRVDESIRNVHTLHPLAGKTAQVCHGSVENFPGVPVAWPETNLQAEYTTGNYSIVPEQYVTRVE